MTTAPLVLAATSEYSLALALEDFVPSFLALAGSDLSRGPPPSVTPIARAAR